MVYRTENAAQTEALGQKLGSTLAPGSVVAFRGRLPAWARPLSPGVLPGAWAVWAGSQAPPLPLSTNTGDVPVHFDMYRLDSSDALFDIGWEDYLDRGGVCAVEWSENVADAMPEGTVYVTIERAPEGENTRIITITGGGVAL